MLAIMCLTVTLSAHAQTPALPPDGAQNDPTPDMDESDASAESESVAVELQSIRYNGYFEIAGYEAMNRDCFPEQQDAFDLSACIARIDETITAEPDSMQRVRLAYLAAMMFVDRDKYGKATPYLERIHQGYPLLNDYIAYYLGECAYKLSNFAKASGYFDMVSEDSRLYLQARFRLALSNAKRKAPNAREELEALLNAHPDHFRSMEARFELAELLRGPAPARAATLYIDVMKERPQNGLGETAENRLMNLSGHTPDKQRMAEIRIAQAERLNDQFEYRRASNLMYQTLAALSDFKPSSEIIGRLRYHYGLALFKRRHYTNAIREFKTVANTKAPKDIQAWALYMRLNARMRKGQPASAIEVGKRLLNLHPDHEKACATRYLIADGYKAMEKPEEAALAYSELVQHHPDCEYTPNALWYIAWLHFKNKNYPTAEQALARIAASDTDRFEKERALYWLARTKVLSGSKRHAVDIYRILVRQYPLSYYSNLAAQRLSDLRVPLPVPYMDRENLSGIPVTVDLALDLKPYRHHPRFIKGVELLKLGQRVSARREFADLRDTFAEDKKLPLMLAYLYYLIEDYPQSIWLFRTRIDDYSYQYPHKGNRSGWLLAYPYLFSELTERYCAQVGLDPLLLEALMREESSFQTDVRSFAHAVGLTQIIASTGRHIARQLGVSGFRIEDLSNPETSIRFGSFHLDELIERFDGNHALAISSYNAGETAVWRWIREQGQDTPMDVFIEEIPYSETRRYTRRVLKSYGIYRYLYSEDNRGFDLWHSIKSRE